jgi:hypothetical protein
MINLITPPTVTEVRAYLLRRCEETALALLATFLDIPLDSIETVSLDGNMESDDEGGGYFCIESGEVTTADQKFKFSYMIAEEHGDSERYDAMMSQLTDMSDELKWWYWSKKDRSTVELFESRPPTASELHTAYLESSKLKVAEAIAEHLKVDPDSITYYRFNGSMEYNDEGGSDYALSSVDVLMGGQEVTLTWEDAHTLFNDVLYYTAKELEDIEWRRDSMVRLALNSDGPTYRNATKTEAEEYLLLLQADELRAELQRTLSYEDVTSLVTGFAISGENEYDDEGGYDYSVHNVTVSTADGKIYKLEDDGLIDYLNDFLSEIGDVSWPPTSPTPILQVAA